MARYLIKFSKGQGIKFISHLDLMRSIQRAVRRSGIPISYSKGFNPHSEFSFATPLSVGTWSMGEYMEIRLDYGMEPMGILSKVNESLPKEIRLLSIVQIDDKFPAAMAVVEAASYEISIINVPNGIFDKNAADNFISMEHIEVVKSGKKGDRVVDIKPMILSFNVQRQWDNGVDIFVTVETGSRSNLNPELLVDGMKKYIKDMEKAEIRDIKKIETYVKRNGRFITPLEFAESDYI